MSTQSEAILENNLIKQLIGLGYTSAKVMDGDALVANLKAQFKALIDDYIFIDNEQSEQFSHLSNWEIKVFTKATPKLSKYALDNMIKRL